MNITFCGHSNCNCSDTIKAKILHILENLNTNETIQFYLGNYGAFDILAKQCCLIYKKTHPNCKLVFITPYLNDSYLKNKNPVFSGYDEIVFPSLENIPPKYRILKRNIWMIKNSQLLISYVNCTYGGAFQTLINAKKENIKIINLGRIAN